MSSTDNIIILKSSDGESFEVKEAVALQFGCIRKMFEEKEAEDFDAKGLPLPNVTSRILSKVIDYCEMHVGDVNTDRDDSVAGDDDVAGDDLEAWYAEGNRAALLGLIRILFNVTGQNLSGVIEYCKRHVVDKDHLKAWDAEFVKVDRDTFSGLSHAANYLHIEGLLDLIKVTLADTIRGRTAEEFRKTWDIENDLTDEKVVPLGLRVKRGT